VVVGGVVVELAGQVAQRALGLDLDEVLVVVRIG
jgi:hypothetical protein